ncbi:hypothetical protein [Sphingomonas elodea]|uniref:hypothetical protein n=1 Tax=Sphingomonas elodea TaxID=179878 RepID=UPI001300BFED|nr:hypothetical protein [Sphingomonas elodea]
MVIYDSPGAPAQFLEGMGRERAIQEAHPAAGKADSGGAGFKNCCCCTGTSGPAVPLLHHRRAAGRKGLAMRTVGKLPHANVNLNCRDKEASRA